MKNNYIRDLSDNELTYIKFSKVANTFMQFVLECKEINTSKLNNYLEKITDDIKELNITIDKDKFIYKKQKLQVTEIINSGFNGYNFESLDLFFKTTADELIEVYNIISNKKSYLLFRISHTLMDGQGFLIFLNIFFNNIKKMDKVEFTNCFESDIDFIKNIETIKDKRNLNFNNRLLHKSTSKLDQNYIKRISIKKDVTFVLSKIIFVFNNYYKNNDLTYLISTDIRRYDRSKISISNLTEPLYLKCQKSDSWYDISKKIYNQLKKKDNLNIKNIVYGKTFKVNTNFFSFIIKTSKFFQKSTNRFLTAGSITNVGTFNNDLYKTKDIYVERMFVIPFYQPLLPFAISIIENKNNVEIVFASNYSIIDENIANQIINDIKTELMSD
ncbi:MAG: hypothetical protein PHO63_02980 [Bacilli bacterium]|nr:hypothetical protein [Bacilli bacterium]MDD4809215.1 hypothetical protein [Bacilli bacterium]